MLKKTLVVLALIMCFFFSHNVSAETIILKSGKTIEGKLIEKTGEYIKIDFAGVPLTYFLDEVESIDGKLPLPDIISGKDNKITKSTESSESYFKSGQDYLYKGDYNQAVTYLKKALELDANYAQAHAYLGLAYYYLKEFPLAKDNFLKAKELSIGKDAQDKVAFVDKYLDLVGSGYSAKEFEEALNKNSWIIYLAGFIANFYLKYGPFFSNLFIILIYLVVLALIILTTFFLLKANKYFLPFPVILVFGLLILLSVSRISVYLFIRNFIEALLYAGAGENVPISSAVVQSTKELRYLQNTFTGNEGVKTFIVSVVYLFSGAYLLTLHKSARKVVLWVLGYFAVSSILLSLFRIRTTDLPFSSVIAFIVAYFCLREDYFKE